jgi:hypothetical protein
MAPQPSPEWRLTRMASFPRLRALAWHGDQLYASRGYTLLRAAVGESGIAWSEVARYHPPAWRSLSSSFPLAFRLFRDGFHAAAVLSSGEIIGVVPGAVVRLAAGENAFHVCHKVVRGTRPLHLATTPRSHIYWGEYFDNAARDEVHIYASGDRGASWNVAYTFPRGSIRHVHNIVYDRWADCLWILTGDNGSECRILRANYDLSTVDTVLSGNQQARAVALVPAADGLYFSSDTPFETNHVYFLDRQGKLSQLALLSSSSIYGCRAGEAIFFSTMVEPSAVNRDRHVAIFGSPNGESWQRVLHWKKDAWPMRLFQYGNAFLPDGENRSNALAVTTAAVSGADLEASLWLVNISHPVPML